MDGTRCEASLTIELDGEVVWQEGVRSDEPPKPIDISLVGHETLTLRRKQHFGDGAAYWEPRILKSTLASAPTGAKQAGPASLPPSGQVPAGFVVDPNDLEKLARSLRNRVESTDAMKGRLAHSQIALMTFDLIDVPSASVAVNVREDLSTAMINNGFQLGERGQLDKAVKELKIQNSGLVDPETAKKIGMMTGCDVILLGSISDRGLFVVINGRLVDTSTGKAIVAERVEMRKIPLDSRR